MKSRPGDVQTGGFGCVAGVNADAKRPLSRLLAARQVQRSASTMILPKQHSIRHLHLLSVATGSVAHQIIGAAKSQFSGLEADIATHAFVDSQDKIQRIVASLTSDSIVFHALLDPSMKLLVEQLCQRRGIPTYDLTGSIMRFMSEQTGMQPEYQPVRAADAEYYRRVDGLEFTLQHDDSRRMMTLHEAEIVLVGISRVSKTPTSVYLGSLGFKVANISFTPQIGLPPELETRHSPICALTIKPKRLREVRLHRMQLNQFSSPRSAAGGSDPYTDMRAVVREVMEAERIYREHGFPVVDVTDQTVEATAVNVLQTLGLERPTY